MKLLSFNIRTLFFLLLLFILSGCKSLLPESLDALGNDVDYLIKEFSPTLGRKTMYQNSVNLGRNSSLPISFEIVNVWRVDGTKAAEVTDKHPVKIWKKNYTGKESSLEEIESKREIEYRPLLEVGKNSGIITIWDIGKFNELVKTVPDSGYIFDVEISNSGGRKYVRNLKFKPQKERPYEPSPYNSVTGLATVSSLPPSENFNLVGERNGEIIFSDKIEVYVFRDFLNTSPKKTLTISLLDSSNNLIDIESFKDTDWKGMIHGFKHQFKNKKLVYEVAYPIPLIEYPTKYTDSGGSRARVRLVNDRIGFGGFLSRSVLGFDFAIYEEGHWEIQFRFREQSPKFVND